MGRVERIVLLVGLGLIPIAGGDIDGVGDIGLVLVLLGVVAVLLYLFVPSSDENRK